MIDDLAGAMASTHGRSVRNTSEATIFARAGFCWSTANVASMTARNASQALHVDAGAPMASAKRSKPPWSTCSKIASFEGK